MIFDILLCFSGLSLNRQLSQHDNRVIIGCLELIRKLSREEFALKIDENVSNCSDDADRTEQRAGID